MSAISFESGTYAHPSNNMDRLSVWAVIDQAAVDAALKDSYGGIDLGNASSMLEIRRDGKGMPLPLSQQPMELRNVEGFTPLIINVMPFNPAAILSQIEGAQPPPA